MIELLKMYVQMSEWKWKAKSFVSLKNADFLIASDAEQNNNCAGCVCARLAAWMAQQQQQQLRQINPLVVMLRLIYYRETLSAGSASSFTRPLKFRLPPPSLASSQPHHHHQQRQSH